MVHFNIVIAIKNPVYSWIFLLWMLFAKLKEIHSITGVKNKSGLRTQWLTENLLVNYTISLTD